MGFRLQGSGFGVYGLGLPVQGFSSRMLDIRGIEGLLGPDRHGHSVRMGIIAACARHERLRSIVAKFPWASK